LFQNATLGEDIEWGVSELQENKDAFSTMQMSLCEDGDNYQIQFYYLQLLQPMLLFKFKQ
jgi:hypothetical protein